MDEEVNAGAARTFAVLLGAHSPQLGLDSPFARGFTQPEVPLRADAIAPVSTLLLFSGLLLWAPGLAILNVAGRFGLQPMVPVAAALLIVTWRRFRPQPTLLLCIGLATSAIALGAANTLTAPGNRLSSGAAEILALGVGVALASGINRDPRRFARFMDGYVIGGLFSSAVAIWQLFAYRIGAPLAYIPRNNLSFSLLDSASALVHKRAFAVTPEPSVLASLLLPLLAVLTVELISRPRRRTAIALVLGAGGLFAASSQSIALAPAILAVAMVLGRRVRQRGVRRGDIWLAIVGLGLASGVVLAFPAALSSISRFGDRSPTSSFGQRADDVSAALRAVEQRPLTGWGAGSVGEVLTTKRRELRLDATAGATSGALRVAVELGAVGVIAMVAFTARLLPDLRRLGGQTERAEAVAMAVALTASFTLFVGYRNLYHPWLILGLVGIRSRRDRS